MPVEITWTTGQVCTAAQLNSNLRDAINFLTAKPLFIGVQTVAQSIANLTWSGLALDTEEIDRDGGHSTTSQTYRYFSQTAGWYHVDGVSAWSTNATGSRATRINANGVAKTGRVSYLPAASATATAVHISGKVYLNAGDPIVVEGSQSSTAALNTAVASDVASSVTIAWYSS